MAVPRSFRAKSFMDWQNRAMRSMRAVGTYEIKAEVLVCELIDQGFPCTRQDVSIYDSYIALHTEAIRVEYHYSDRTLKATKSYIVNRNGPPRWCNGDNVKFPEKVMYLTESAGKNMHELARMFIKIMKDTSEIFYNMTIVIRKIYARMEQMHMMVVEKSIDVGYPNEYANVRFTTMSHDYEFCLEEDNACNDLDKYHLSGSSNNAYGADFIVNMKTCFEFIDIDKTVDAMMKHLLRLRIMGPSISDNMRTVRLATNIKYCAMHEIFQDYSFKPSIDWSKARHIFRYEKPGYVFVEIENVGYDDMVTMEYHHGEGFSDGSTSIVWDRYTLKSNKYETLYKNVSKIAKTACGDRN